MLNDTDFGEIERKPIDQLRVYTVHKFKEIIEHWSPEHKFLEVEIAKDVFLGISTIEQPIFKRKLLVME